MPQVHERKRQLGVAVSGKSKTRCRKRERVDRGAKKKETKKKRRR